MPSHWFWLLNGIHSAEWLLYSVRYEIAHFFPHTLIHIICFFFFNGWLWSHLSHLSTDASLFTYFLENILDFSGSLRHLLESNHKKISYLWKPICSSWHSIYSFNATESLQIASRSLPKLCWVCEGVIYSSRRKPNCLSLKLSIQEPRYSSHVFYDSINIIKCDSKCCLLE